MVMRKIGKLKILQIITLKMGVINKKNILLLIITIFTTSSWVGDKIVVKMYIRDTILF
mgnify:CR=1 FL=1